MLDIMLLFFLLKILTFSIVGKEPEPEPEVPEPHQNFHPEPDPHKNDASPPH
jgi:hypothetical protein